MKNRLRIIALCLWLVPVALCLAYSIFAGFTLENYGAAMAIHNGLNPFVYDHEEASVWISIVVTLGLLGYVLWIKPTRIGDVTLLSLILASYFFSAVQFLRNFHPG